MFAFASRDPFSTTTNTKILISGENFHAKENTFSLCSSYIWATLSHVYGFSAAAYKDAASATAHMLLVGMFAHIRKIRK